LLKLFEMCRCSECSTGYWLCKTKRGLAGSSLLIGGTVYFTDVQSTDADVREGSATVIDLIDWEIARLYDPRWSLENRPYEMARDVILFLSRFLLIGQVCFGPPAPRSAFEDMAVVEKAVEHGGDSGGITP
jgi:hypothetical protein